VEGFSSRFAQREILPALLQNPAVFLVPQNFYTVPLLWKDFLPASLKEKSFRHCFKILLFF
jgi:hypothetical protein